MTKDIGGKFRRLTSIQRLNYYLLPTYLPTYMYLDMHPKIWLHRFLDGVTTTEVVVV